MNSAYFIMQVTWSITISLELVTVVTNEVVTNHRPIINNTSHHNTVYTSYDDEGELFTLET